MRGGSSGPPFLSTCYQPAQRRRWCIALLPIWVLKRDHVEA